MSISKKYYVIAGYDLTKLETDKYRDWKWTDEGEQFLCNQVNGKVQLFDDPMSDGYLYLGRILASGDEWSFNPTKFYTSDVQDSLTDVTPVLYKLQELGVVHRAPLPFQIIAFVEYS